MPSPGQAVTEESQKPPLFDKARASTNRIRGEREETQGRSGSLGYRKALRNMRLCFSFSRIRAQKILKLTEQIA